MGSLSDRSSSLSTPGEIGPDVCEEWRNSRLGTITERIEQETVFDLVGNLREKRGPYRWSAKLSEGIPGIRRSRRLEIIS